MDAKTDTEFGEVGARRDHPGPWCPVQPDSVVLFVALAILA